MCPTSLRIQILIIPISKYIVGTLYMPSWLLKGLISNGPGFSSLQVQSPGGDPSIQNKMVAQLKLHSASGLGYGVPPTR